MYIKNCYQKRLLPSRQCVFSAYNRRFIFIFPLLWSIFFYYAPFLRLTSVWKYRDAGLVITVPVPLCHKQQIEIWYEWTDIVAVDLAWFSCGPYLNLLSATVSLCVCHKVFTSCTLIRSRTIKWKSIFYYVYAIFFIEFPLLTMEYVTFKANNFTRYIIFTSTKSFAYCQVAGSKNM